MARIAFSAALLGATMLASCAATTPASSPASAPSAQAAQWYIMIPPPKMPPAQDAQGNFLVNPHAPLSQWIAFKTLPSQDQCFAQLKTMENYCRCVPSSDPGLKGNPNLKQAAPANGPV